MTSALSTRARGRFEAVDIARSVAVLLALAGHAQQNYPPVQEGQDFLQFLLGAVTRFGTPTFIILFGAMIEIVYARKTRLDPGQDLLGRTAERALHCYLFFVATSLAALANQHYGVAHFIGSIGFVAPGRYGNVLKLYVIILLLVPVIVRLRVRFGFAALFAILCVTWTAHLGLKTVEPPPPLSDSKAFMYTVGTFLGIGREGFSPSLLDAFTFVFAGQMIGAFVVGVADSSVAVRRRAMWSMTGFVVILLVLLVAFAALYEGDVASDWAGFRLRREDHPLYFVIGVLGALALLAVASAVAAVTPERWRAPLGAAGRHTLLVYSLGNILLNLSPRSLQGETSPARFFGFLAVMTIAALLIDAADRHGRDGVATRAERLWLALRRESGRLSRRLSDALLVAARRWLSPRRGGVASP